MRKMITNNTNQMNVLLIGGAGFIGIHTAELLHKKGYRVVIVDDFSSSTRDALVSKHTLYSLDASNYDALDSVYDRIRPDAVFIFSSVVDVPSTIKDPLTIRAGMLSLMNAAELSVKYGVKKNIFASSGYVYGNKNIIPYSEEADLDPVNPYNISKIFAENILNFYSGRWGLNTIILRYAPTYGPRRVIGPIADFIKKALSNESITLYGSVTRDYIFVEDVASANLYALEKNITGSEVINIGTGEEVSLEYVYKQICDILKIKPLEILQFESKDKEINRFCLNIEKAKTRLDFVYKNDLREGLAKTIEWIKSQDEN